MSQAQEQQHYLHAGEQIRLPSGVTISDWALERLIWQNPRIRAFLGCIRLLGEVLESNYAILHCSPDRLLEIWRRVRRVAELIRTELAPLLSNPSQIPSLEQARQSAHTALELLEGNVLGQLDGFPQDVPKGRLIEIRKLLCVSIGQLHSFLQDTFGSLMAADPRSQHDADYFLSRRFPQDIDEAEWLHATVLRLKSFMDSLEQVRSLHLTAVAAKVEREQMIPSRNLWRDTVVFLETLLTRVTPRIKEVLALRGVRFYEMEILDRYAIEVPNKCQVLLQIQDAGRELIDALKSTDFSDRAAQEQAIEDMVTCQGVLSKRMAALMRELDRSLQDLVTFVPIWLDQIQKRRALMLHAEDANGSGPSVRSAYIEAAGDDEVDTQAMTVQG